LQICRDISSSNYKINPQGQVFTEFETIENALIRLAHQVESQIHTLVEAKEQAEQGEKTKAQFVANISHEIRTPMNGIIGYIQVLEQSELKPDAKQQVLAIKHACLQLLNILNDVLDLSKLDEEAIEISKENFSLRDIFTNIYDIFLPSFEQKGVAFDIAFSDTVPDFVSADELRIRQVVSNITSNALKFTESGYVTIEIDYDKSKSSLVIVVTDTGIGIKEEYLEKLFLPFSQEDGHVARKYGGTGLGLNISKKLLDLMQGSIQVKSKPGEGATFVVDIPITETTARVIEVPARKSSTPDLSSTSILIAEDNITNQMVIKALLKPTKAQLTMANNGEEAIEKIRESSFDIVLMDVQMPVLDGLSSTRILREEMDFEKPIIGVSANALQHDLDEAIDAGMSDYISKPIIKEELYKTLEKWCREEDL
jgi:signal transduction histidine kinase/CheY-like chemotaxis protein